MQGRLASLWVRTVPAARRIPASAGMLSELAETAPQQRLAQGSAGLEEVPIHHIRKRFDSSDLAIGKTRR